ncbi:MAG: hypothetical protein KF764_33405 [Labilithrix sp.]|nr:hypothetical protein [Labilithrix sp.]MBX3225591.1 hypothetical protein [Labilithrix sp.]
MTGVRVSGSARAVALASWLLVTAGCLTDAGETVSPHVEVVGRVSIPLASGELTSMNGTYSGCTARSGMWSLRIAGTDPLDHDALTVVKNDVGCTLTLTELVAGATSYAASPAIPLGSSYAVVPSVFSDGNGGAFRANARVDSLTFSSDFNLTLVHSTDVSSSSVDVVAAYASVEASSVAVGVLPPDYALSFDSSFNIQMDAAKLATFATGTITLNDGARVGALYVVDEGTLGPSPTYAAVLARFTSGPQLPLTVGNPKVAAAQLALVGQSLNAPVVRTIIASRVVGGVLGFQLFRVTFKAS